MVNILVESNGNCHIKSEGMTVFLLAELGVGLENFVKNLVKDCPKELNFMIKDLIKDTVNYAIDEAFREK